MTDGYLTDWPTSERFPHYTRANAGEVMGCLLYTSDAADDLLQV